MIHSQYNVEHQSKLNENNKSMQHSKWIHKFQKEKGAEGGNQTLEADIAIVQNTLMSMQEKYIREAYEYQCLKLFNNKPKSSFLERLNNPPEPNYRVNRVCR